MLTFALAVFLLIITPGPGVLSTAGVGAAFGWRQGLYYVGGLCAGTNLVALAVIQGRCHHLGGTVDPHHLALGISRVSVSRLADRPCGGKDCVY